MTKKILTEFFPIDYSNLVLNEGAGASGPVILKNVVIQRANAKNQNGRIYPREVLVRESKRYVDEFVRQRRAMGELDHPEERTVVNLANVSHILTELHWEGDDLRGDIQILSTPMGNIVKELMRNRIRLGVSSRGVGSVDNIDESTDEVQPDFNLICFDIVSNPSTQGAFINESVKNALQESKNYKINELINDFFTELQTGKVK